MGESSIITGVLAFLFGGGAVAVLWKPLAASLLSLGISNRAGGEIISNYKEQVQLLKESNAILREENDELRDRHDKNLRRISTLETDLKLIKNALSILLAMSETSPSVDDQRFRTQIDVLIAKMESNSDDEQR